MNEQSLTQKVLRSLSQVLHRFVRSLNAADLGTGTEAPIDTRQMQQLETRARCESECV